MTATHSQGKMADLLKNTQIYFIGNVLNRLGAFLLIPLYTHYLTADQYGILELILVSVSLIRAFLGLNMGHATLRFYFEYKTKEDQNQLTSTMVIFTGLWCLAFCVLFFFLSKSFSIWMTGTDRYVYLFQLAFIILCFEVVSEIPSAILRAQERAGMFVAASCMNLLLRVGVNIYLVAMLQKGVEGILIGNLIATAIIWGVLLAFTMRGIRLQYDYKKMAILIQYSIPLAMAAIPGLLIKNADRLFLGQYASLTALGLYALAMRFSMILEGFVLEPFYLGFGPFRFSIVDQNNAKPTFARLMTYFTFLLSLAGLMIILFAPELIAMVSTEAFQAADKIVPPLVLATMLQGMHYVFQSGLLIANQTRLIPPISAAAALLNFSALYLLTQSLGAFGAALSVALASFLNTFLTYRLSQRYYPIPYEWDRITKIIGAALFVYGLSLFAVDIGFWSGLLVKSVGVLVFLLLLFLGVTTQEEKEKMVFFRKKIGAFLTSHMASTEEPRHQETEKSKNA